LKLAEQKPEIMQRKVGLFETVAMIVGLVIGASIFVLLPTMTNMTGPSVYLALGVACIPSIFVVLFEIQLTGTLPVTGANYVTVTRIAGAAWGSIIAFAAVLALLASNVLCAVGFSQYVIGFIQSFNPSFALNPAILAIAIVVFFALINFFGVSVAAWIQVFLFLCLLIGIAIFGIVGAAHVNPVNLTPLFPNGALMFIVVVVLGCVAWSGLVALADIGGDVKNPRRNLPAALIIAFVVILFLYTMQPYGLVASMNWQEVGKIGNTAVMVDAGRIMPGIGIYVVFVAAMGAILTTINALIWSCARDLVAWARDGLLPKAVTHLNPKFKSADLAILVITILSIAGILLAATIDKYALASVLALMVIQIVLAWSVLQIPKKLPDLYAKSLIKFNTFWRWFTFLGAVITSVFILLMGILLDTMDSKGNPTQIPWTVFIFLGVLVVGAIWYLSRKAYLKSKGIDLDGNLKKVADATLAEAEEKLAA
jgi:basic amino acid/polyamine antiporter, APA family